MVEEMNSETIQGTPKAQGADPDRVATRRSRAHVYIVDGTLSSLTPGCETHAGRLYGLLRMSGQRAEQSFGYHPGVQGAGWRKWWNAITGDGLNHAILEGYAAIASRYRPGDRIYLFGYSRGAYAVRSLAGMIGRVGLLRPERAAERRVIRAFRYYQAPEIGRGAAEFRRRHCHPDAAVSIQMIGVWDTVRALGPPYPLVSYLGWRGAAFHDDALTDHVRAAYQALALDEDRVAFAPVLWRRRPGWSGRLEQRWFPGAHGDVGGERGCDPLPLPLSNLSLRWMLERAEAQGLALPEDWRAAAPCDPAAPMVGSRRGASRFFLLRRRRVPGRTDGEIIDPSAARRQTMRGPTHAVGFRTGRQNIRNACQ